MNLSNIAILKIENADYHCIISGISKSEATNLMQNIDLTETQWNIIEKHKNLLKINTRSNFWKCKFTSNSNLNEKSGNS